MQLNSLLKTLIDIAYVFMIPVVVFFPGTILYLVFFPQQTIIKTNIPIEGNGIPALYIIALFVMFIEFVLFFVGFHNLRQLSKHLLKKSLISKLSVNYLKRIGQFFSISGGSSLVLFFLFNLIQDSKISIEFGVSNYQLLLFLFIIGVFFLLLNQAFEKALKIKTENDLTV
jgi:hypothetical protein